MSEKLAAKQWRTEPLGAVASIDRDAINAADIRSGSLYVGLENITSGGEFVAVTGVTNGELASTKFRFSSEHILYGKLRPYLSKIALPDFSGVCSTDILPILPGPKLHKGFLFHFLRQPRMVAYASSRTTGANLPRLSPKELSAFEIPLPPLAQQKRIADILDKADAIRRKRQEAMQESLSNLESTFLELFGDPVANSRRWDKETFGDHLTFIQYGPRFYNEQYTPSGVRIVRITDLDFQGNLDFSAMPTLDVADADKKQYCLRPGDLLLARSGATVGKTALISDLSPECIAGAYFIRMRFDESISPLFAQMVLRSQGVQRIIADRSRQSAQQNLNGPAIRELPLIVPPVSLQRTFEKHHQNITKFNLMLNKAIEESEELFASLVHRAFKGEL